MYSLQAFDCTEISGHEGGRNRIFVFSNGDGEKFVLRVSALGDRTEQEYLAETEFVHYLAAEGAPVVDVVPSINGRLVECVVVEAARDARDSGNTRDVGDAGGAKGASTCDADDAQDRDDASNTLGSGDADNAPVFLSLFEYARGMLLCDNGYRYRDGAPLEEYFYNTGKTLGKIHALSKRFTPSSSECRRPSYFEKYNMDYINRLIPDTSGTYTDLKNAIAARLCEFKKLPTDTESFGLVHFDYSDGNYHIDMATGDITVFDFDNCMYCWYMFDLANLRTHGEGWFRGETNATRRQDLMNWYFHTILEGYKTETTIPNEMLNQLSLFIDMVLIENIVDEFECCAREGENVDYEDIKGAAEWLLKK